LEIGGKNDQGEWGGREGLGPSGERKRGHIKKEIVYDNVGLGALGGGRRPRKQRKLKNGKKKRNIDFEP